MNGKGRYDGSWKHQKKVIALDVAASEITNPEQIPAHTSGKPKKKNAFKIEVDSWRNLDWTRTTPRWVNWVFKSSFKAEAHARQALKNRILDSRRAYPTGDCPTHNWRLYNEHTGLDERGVIEFDAPK